ncbi:MAG: arsenite methyltransferase [Clostridia bacterium]|nr:MAG: arsenite methyltransferase [Clostridia bacterium]
MAKEQEIERIVRERYQKAARQMQSAGAASCCGPATCCGTPNGGAFGRTVYLTGQEDIPTDALQASLGCGNPTALAGLAPGEVVLDLGCGGGLDVLLAARRVGPKGRVYGLDFTPEMLALARRNAAAAGVDNVEFLEGEMENVPLADATVDVIISNCVINLSVDKERVLREAWRVLRPGGRLAISDIVLLGALPSRLKQNLELWAGCVAGALGRDEYLNLLQQVGFSGAEVVVTNTYSRENLSQREGLALAPEEVAAAEGKIASAFVRATKPQG